MELEGKIISILELQSGASAKGGWQRQNFVVETLTEYPKKVCVTLWGDKVNVLSTLKTGDTVSMSIDIESREFNGKWYTDVKAFRIEKSMMNAPAMDEPPMPSQNDYNAIYSQEDDLVF